MQQGTRNALLIVDSIPGPGSVRTPEGFDDIASGIWVESVSLGAQQLGSEMAAGSGAEAERNRQVMMTPVTITRRVDSATTAIFNSMLTARRFPEMRISLLRPHGTDGRQMVYFSVKLEHAAFSSQQFAAGGGGGEYMEMIESIEIVYNKIQYMYADETWVPGSNQGTYQSATWDQRAHSMV